MTIANILKSGSSLEYLTMAVFQAQGHLVRRTVWIKYGADDQHATDIDVLGIKFTNPFQPHRIVFDCKDRARSKPFERIFWVKGVSTFVEALEAYVILPRISWDIINFARSGQVRILTKQILEDAYKKTYGEDGKAYGLADHNFYEPFYKRMNAVCKKNKLAPDILFHTRTLYLVRDPYVSFNIAMTYLSKCVEELSKYSESEDLYQLWRYIAADLIVLISLLLLYIAADTIGFAKTERQRHIISRLTYGDISEKKAKEIFTLAKELAIETAKLSLQDKSVQSLLPFDIGNIEHPHYAPSVAGLVERAFVSPSLYHDLPRLVDFLLFEQSLKNIEFSQEQYVKTFPDSNQNERLKIARNIFVFIRDSLGLDMKVFWQKEDQNLPKMKEST
jgi:hypothetical protein